MERPAYRITSNAAFGRYLVADRDIKQGEVILREAPRMLGSQIAAFPICFKCASRLYTRAPPPCSRCGLAPTCGPCKGTLHEAECAYMRQMSEAADVGLTLQFLCDNPQVAMPLRCLLMKFYDHSSWKELLSLESHLKERRGTHVFDLHQAHVERPLARVLHLMGAADDELLQTICGVLDVNCFEVRPSGRAHGPEDCLRGLYLRPALMAHDCVCNTHLSVDDDFLMTVRASLPIHAGDMITFCYTNGLQGTLDRQRHLREGKYFTCSCRRCADPTELGTGLSTLICPKCKQATVIFRDNQWQCPACAKSFSNRMMHTALAIAKDKVQTVLEGGTLQSAKDLLASLQRTLHQQHGLIIEVKQKIIPLLGGESDEAATLEKIALCRELSEVLSALEPGISRHLGIAQYELHNAIVQLGKSQYSASQITLHKYLSLLKQGEAILKAAIGHLIYEPKGAPEGRLAQKALTDLRVLRATTEDVEAMAQKMSEGHE